MASTDANYELLYAARSGSLRGVEAALKAGADIDFDHVDCESSSTGTALFNACLKGHIDVIKLLLRKGASMVKRNRTAFAPLHVAVYEGRTGVVDLLVQHGATVDIQDGFQNTPLMYACVYNHVNTVKRLIQLGARPRFKDGYVAQGDCGKSVRLIQAAAKTKLLRCCNPKCGKPGYRNTLKLCAVCKLTRYCSRDCQKQHWSVGHKKCCGHDAYTEEGPHPIDRMKSHPSTCPCYKRGLNFY